MICVSNESYEKEILNLEMLANGVVDGIILSISKETEERDDYQHFNDLMRNGIPLVMFDRVVDKIECNKVIADDVGGAFLATEHLIQNGCSNIVLITTPDYVVVGNERKMGYAKALKEYKVPVRKELVLKVEHEDQIESALKNLILSSNPPDGIFAVNEVYAAVAMRVCRENGLAVPEDVEVIGFTDGVISEFTSPPLTTVAQHGRHIGRKALELLLDEIDSQEQDYKYKTALIQTDLKIRNSTKKVQMQN
jgi:LacI family transcriptional regulator